MLQPRGSPSYSLDCRAVQLRVKRRDCKSFELDCKSFELDCKSFELDCESFELDCKSFELECKSFELDCISCFHLLALCCLLSTFFSAEAVLGTTEAVSLELLAEAV